MKKISVSILPLISLLAITASLFLPLLQLPLLFLSSAAIAISLISNESKKLILVIASLISIGIIYLVSRSIPYTLLASIFGIIGGVSVGLCFAKGNSFKDSIIKTTSALLVACIVLIFAFTYIQTGSFDLKAAFKPIVTEIKNICIEELNAFAELYPQYVKDVSATDIIDTAISTFISFSPAMITIASMLYAVLLFWAVKALSINTFNILEPQTTEKFSDTHVGKLTLALYIISAIISITSASGFMNILASNVYIVLNAVFAYAGLSMVSYLLMLKKINTIPRRLLIVAIVVLSMFLSSGLSLLSIFGIVFDTLLNLREKIRRQGE